MIIEETKIVREKGFLYYINKAGDVETYDKKTRAKKTLIKLDIKKEKGYFYYVDKAGNVASCEMRMNQAKNKNDVK